ncbi:hypothetical protein [Methylopila sp. 73B]|uniref:hypothetical protein n=1 Tax=Methylopila sp. 73B TaxID=1120792 RepID=UPI0012DBD4B9|nr:hypothetical protein [Methylopila sp. 73B]
MKSLVLDLPLAIGAETMRFNVRLAIAWLDHIGRVAALNGPPDAGPLMKPNDGPPVSVAPTSPYAVAAKLAA